MAANLPGLSMGPGQGPDTGPSGPGPDMTPRPPSLHEALEAQHGMAKAQFDKLSEAKGTLDKVRLELESLSKMGDMVTPEDVIKGAGSLVSHGVSPAEMASLLAEMPQGGGDAIQQWVQGHLDAVSAQEARLGPALASAQHHLGLAGLRLVAGHLGMPVGGPGPSMPNLTSNGGSGAA